MGIPRCLEGDLRKLASVWGPPKTMKVAGFLPLPRAELLVSHWFSGKLAQTGTAAKWGQLATEMGLAWESGWAGKARKEAFPAQGNNGEMKWKLRPLSTSTFPTESSGM